MKISKPDMSNVWAEGGSVAVVPSEKISQGWVVEIPPCEQMNFVQNRQDAGIAYMLQQGIPEWDSSTEYQAVTSYAQFDGVAYKAIGTNTNKPPTTFPDFWEKAFDDAGSAQVVQDQLDAIEADADPFEQYLLEVDAAKYGIKTDLDVTNKLTATNLNVIDDGVYQFDNTCANRPFDSGKILQNTSGLVLYQYSESLTQGLATRTSTGGVFTDWKYSVTSDEILDISTIQSQLDSLATSVEKRKIQVGDMFLTLINFLAPSEVAAHLGYGTWTRFAQGTALVGMSDVPSHPVWTKSFGNGYGEYEHTLTVAEMPSHNHGSIPEIKADSDRGTASSSWSIDTSQAMTSVGGSQPHTNVQPSVIIGVWYRVS